MNQLIAVLAIVAIAESVLLFAGYTTALTLQEYRSQIGGHRWIIFYTGYAGVVVVFIVGAIFSVEFVNGDSFVNVFSQATGFARGAVLATVVGSLKG